MYICSIISTPSYDVHVVLSSASHGPVKSNEWFPAHHGDFRRSSGLCWEGLCDPPGAARRAEVGISDFDPFGILKQIVTDWNILKPSKLIKTCCQLSKNQPALQSLERIWPGAHTAGAVWSAEQPFGMSFERRRLAWLIRRFTQRFNMFNGRGLRPGRGAQKGARSQRAAALSVRRRQGDHLEARLTRLTRLTPVPTLSLPGWWMPGKQMPCFLVCAGGVGMMTSCLRHHDHHDIMIAMPGAEVFHLESNALLWAHEITCLSAPCFAKRIQILGWPQENRQCY